MRKRFDQLAKQGLVAMLDLAGATQPETEVSAEAQTIDAWFVPDPSRAETRRTLGLLGRMAAQPALFEPFHAAPGEAGRRGCTLVARRRCGCALSWYRSCRVGATRWRCDYSARERR